MTEDEAAAFVNGWLLRYPARMAPLVQEAKDRGWTRVQFAERLAQFLPSPDGWSGPVVYGEPVNIA